MPEPPLRVQRVTKTADKAPSPPSRAAWPLIACTGLLLLAGPLFATAQESPQTLHPSAFVAFGLLAALLGLYRPFGGSGLGLAALLVVPLCVQHGSVLGAWVATLGALGAETLRRLLEARGTDPAPERRRPTRVVADALRVGAAVLLAGVVYHRTPAEIAADWGWSAEVRIAPPLVASLVVYVAVLLALDAVERALGGRQGRPGVRDLVPALAESAGWLASGLLASALAAVGWIPLLPPLAMLSVLALQLARSSYEHADLERKIRTLRSVGGAGERVAPSTHEGRELAHQIAAEIRQTLDFSWFHLELLEPDGSATSYRAGADGVVEAGAPMPAPSPPAVPGIHRRRQWAFIDRELSLEGQTIGRVRLWCDPRRVDNEALETLELLLPQVAMSADRARLDREAHTDSLTGISVRRVLTDGLDQALDRARTQGSGVSVLLCDIDHFKAVNDTWGHGVGDTALRAVAGALRSRLRSSDICCRYGGEEFALLLDGALPEQALETAERLRRRVEALELEVEGRAVPLTISIGAASFPQVVVADGSELLEVADEALYAAKAMGRNQALLFVGRGLYQSVDGRVHGDHPEPIEVPRL